MKKLIGLFAVVAWLLILSASLALAKEGPEKLTISGPGLKDVVEVTDPALTDGLNPFEFIARRHNDLKSPKLGDGYELTAYYKEDGQFKPSNRLRYHLNPSGGLGFVYYIGAGEFGHVSNDDGKWFCASNVSDSAMRRLLHSLKVQVADVSNAPEKLMLKGPGLVGEVQLKSSDVNSALEQLTYYGWGRMAVPKVDNGYELTRYVKDCTGQFVADTRLRYYPGSGGRPGYVYESNPENDNPNSADNWFFTTQQGDAAMQALLKKSGVSAKAVQPTASAITLDNPLPTKLVAGQPVTIGFTVQQSATDPYLPDTLIVYAQHTDQSSYRDVFTAKADGGYGHYKLTLEFARGGTWYWLINAERPNGEQPMPILNVLGSDGKPDNTQASNASASVSTDEVSPLLLALGLMALLGVLGVLFSRMGSRTETQ